MVYGVLFMDWGELNERDVKPFAGVYTPNAAKIAEKNTDGSLDPPMGP